MSGDPEQEYFTDGITEEIITALTHVRWFFVIARNSSFVYRGRLPDVKQVGRELGVRYVLAGSLRRSGNRLRITGQLVEAETGCHLWADRYEGALEDVFELQDRIAESVVAAVEPKLLQVELTRARAKPTDNVGAYELYLRALWHFYPFTKQDNKTALGLLGQAISRDPDFALAHALSGHLHIQRTFQGWSEDRAADLEAGARLARLALQKGGDDPRILWRAALALVHSGHDPTACVALSERAIELSPSSAEAVAMSGWLQVFAGGYEIAVQRFERAKRLSPVEPMLFSFNTGLGLAFMFLGRLDLAIHWASEALTMSQRFPATHRCLAAAHALSGNILEAKNVVQQLLQIDPGASVSSLPVAMRGTPKVEMYIRGLKLAGLPD